MNDDLDQAITNSAIDRITRIESGEDLITVYGKNRSGLGEMMACTEREGDYRQLALKYLASLITPPSDGGDVDEACYYCGNQMDEESGSACSACIARVEAEAMRPPSTATTQLPDGLDLAAMPVVDVEAALAEALEDMSTFLRSASPPQVSGHLIDWRKMQVELLNKARAALALHRKPQPLGIDTTTTGEGS